MYDNGKIDKKAFDTIKTIIDNSIKDQHISEYFRPLIYIIPYRLNEAFITNVLPNEAAGTLSPEYLLEGLPTNRFSIIDLGEEGIR